MKDQIEEISLQLVRNLSSCEKKAWKSSGFNEIRTHDLCDAGAVNNWCIDWTNCSLADWLTWVLEYCWLNFSISTDLIGTHFRPVQVWWSISKISAGPRVLHLVDYHWCDHRLHIHSSRHGLAFRKYCADFQNPWFKGKRIFFSWAGNETLWEELRAGSYGRLC